MRTQIQNSCIESDSKEIVLKFLNALNKEDFETARKYLDDAMVFNDALDHRRGVEDYIRDLREMKFKYKIRKIIDDCNYVSILYDINICGTEVFACGLYYLKNGKISLIKVISEPRLVR